MIGFLSGLLKSRELKSGLLTSLATILFLSSYYLLLPVLPLHLTSLGWGKLGIGNLMSVFSLTSLVIRTPAGIMGDRRGPIAVLFSSALISLVAPVLFLGSSFFPLAIAQAISGIAIGAFSISATGLIALMIPKEHAAEAISWFSIALIVGKGFAPAAGTWIFNRSGYPPAVAAAGLCTLATLLMLKRLGAIAPEWKPARAPTGSTRLATVAAASKEASVATEVPASRGGGSPFASVWASSPKVLWASVLLMAVGITFGAEMTFLPLLAKERGISGASLFFFVQTASVVLVRTFAGRLIDRLGGRGVTLTSMLFLSVSMAILAFAGSLGSLLVVAVVYGFGYAVAYPALTAVVIQRSAPGDRGKALGVFTTAFDLGSALGAALGGLSQYLGFTAIQLVLASMPLLGLTVLPRLFEKYVSLAGD